MQYAPAPLSQFVDLPQLRSAKWQRWVNRGESYHKLRSAVAYANAGRMRVKTGLEQEIWSECCLLANCVILYNASILSELLERKERQNDVDQAE